MPAETEAEERRALQRKAYGRGGGLTAAESQRLRTLEDARHPVDDPQPAPPMGLQRDGSENTPAAQSEPVDGHAAEPGEPATVVPDAPAIPETLPRTLRRYAKTVVAASAVLLVIGVGAGWALFAPRGAGLPLTDEQQQRRIELATDTFDAGSIRALAQTDRAVAWYATQDGGEVLCLILDVGPQSQRDCRSSGKMEYGLSASLPLPPHDADSGDVVEGENVQARLLLSTAGEPMASIQRWGAGSSIADQFSGQERDRAKALVAEGYDFGLSMVGSFRGKPVWLGDRLSEQGAIERCLIVDAWGSGSCQQLEAALRVGVSAQMVDVDSGGTVRATSVLDLQFTGRQTPYLTITETRSASVSVVAPGDFAIVQGPPGDPIQVEPPGRGADD